MFIFTHRNLTRLCLTEQSRLCDPLHARLEIPLQSGSTVLVKCPYLPLLLATTDHTPVTHLTLPNRMESRQGGTFSGSIVFSPSGHHILGYLKTTIALSPPLPYIHLNEINIDKSYIKCYYSYLQIFPTTLHAFNNKFWRRRRLLYDWRSVSQSVSQYVLVSSTPVGLATRYYVLPVGMLMPEICGLASVGRPLWREDGSAVCSVITQCSESRRTRNHTLLSHLRFPQHWGPGSRNYILQEQGGPVIPPCAG
jgi:hypothetical protein